MASGRLSLVDMVESELLDEIDRGALVAGDQLATEYELATRYGVSRQTVREAIQRLVVTGHLLRQRGHGTFVNYPPSRHALDVNVSYTAMIREAGYEPGQFVLRALSRPATAAEIDALDLGERESVPTNRMVLEIERVRLGDGRPLIYSRDRIPMAILEGAYAFGRFEAGALDRSLYGLLLYAGHRVISATAQLTPTLADERLAELLQVAPGAPLLHIEQVDRDTGGRPVMHSDEWHVAGAFDLIVNRREP